MKINKFILGTVQFGLDYGINNSSGKPNASVVSSILDLAFESGIFFLDTAEAYGDAHEVIGNYHKVSPHKFKIITKFSSKRTDLSQNLKDRISQNLETLNVDFLYGYMFHSFHDFENYYEKYKNEIQNLKKEGLIKKFGVSIYTNEEFKKILKFDDIDLVQFPFNLLDNASQRSALISEAKQKGIEIHTRSVFLQGLFFKDIKNLPVKLNSLSSYLSSIHSIASDAKINMSDLSLNYAIQQKNIDYVLIGVDNVEQLKENLKSLNHHIPEDVMNKVNELKVTETELLNPSNWN